MTGAVAFDRHPTTGEVYAIVKAGSARRLVKLNPLVGVEGLARELAVTDVGAMDNKFSDLAFLPSGTLFGVSGNGGAPAETLYTIDPATGAATLYSALGNGADGEVICFNTDDQLMYHFSGNSTAVMEKFSVAGPAGTVTPTSVVAALSPGGEVFGCVYAGTRMIDGASQQLFQITDINSKVRYLTAAGTDVTASVGTFASTPDDLRGILTLPHQLYTATPSTGPVAGGTTVTLTGGALDGVTDVRFGGVAATVVTTSATSITVTTPAAVAPGPVVVTAVIPGTAATVTWQFTYATTAARAVVAPPSVRPAPPVRATAPVVEARRHARGKR